MKKKKFFKEVACLLIEESDLTKLSNEFIRLLAPALDLKTLTLTKGEGKKQQILGQSTIGKTVGKNELLIDITDGKKVLGQLNLTSDSKQFHKDKNVELLTSVACLFASLLKKIPAEKKATLSSPKEKREKSVTLLTLDEVNKQHIEEVLAACDGKIHGKGGAAEILGLNGNTLRNRMDKLKVSYKKNDYPKKRAS